MPPSTPAGEIAARRAAARISGRLLVPPHKIKVTMHGDRKIFANRVSGAANGKFFVSGGGEQFIHRTEKCVISKPRMRRGRFWRSAMRQAE